MLMCRKGVVNNINIIFCEERIPTTNVRARGFGFQRLHFTTRLYYKYYNIAAMGHFRHREKRPIHTRNRKGREKMSRLSEYLTRTNRNKRSAQRTRNTQRPSLYVTIV